jgi:hypothetical protein
VTQLSHSLRQTSFATLTFDTRTLLTRRCDLAHCC